MVLFITFIALIAVITSISYIATHVDFLTNLYRKFMVGRNPCNPGILGWMSVFVCIFWYVCPHILNSPLTGCSVCDIVCGEKKDFLQHLVMHIFNEVASDLAELL